MAIAVGTGIMLSNLRSRALTENERELQNVAFILAEQMERDFGAVESVQTNLIERLRAFGFASSEDYERKMSGYDAHLVLKDKIVGLHHLGTVTLVNSQGKVFNFSRSWPIPDINVADRDFFTTLQSDKMLNSVVSKPIRNRATGTWVVQIARKVSGPNGEFLGLVLGAIELQSIENFFEHVVLGPDSAIALIHRDGELMARYPHVESLIGRPIPNGLAVKLLSNSDRGVGRRIGSVGSAEDRLIAAHRVAHYPLVIAATTNVAAVLADWWRTAVYLIGIAALAILVVAAGTFLVIRQFKNYASLERARAEKIEAKILREQSLRLDVALSNISQGLVMFDSTGRLIVCNDRYRQIYKLPPDLAKPGCTVLDLLKYRVAKETFSDNPEKYVGDLLATIAQGKTASQEVETGDGRIISVVNQPMVDGGWVATHEDVTDKVKTQNAIKNKTQQLNVTLENISQGVCMFDAAQRLIVCNKQYAELYGLNGEQTKPGTSLRAILEYRIASGNSPSDHERYVNDRINEVTANRPYQITNRLSDGRYVSVVHRPMVDGGWVATHEDVTEATRREDSFRLLFKANPVPMWVIDWESLRFLAINDAVVTHYGYSHEQLMSMTASDLRPAEDRERFEQSLRAESDDQLVKNITRHSKADGTTIDVFVYSRALVYAGHKARLVAIHDVTDRKRAEDELRRTKKFIDTVIEHVPVPIIVKDVAGLETDARGSRFTLFNRAYEELTGESRIQLIGKAAYQLFPKERADLIVRSDNETLQSDQVVTTSEHPIITSHNGTRLVIAKKTVIRDENDKPQYLLTVIDDVTERRRSEQRISHMAHYDTLTDLPNRAAFNETMDATLDRAAMSHEQFSILNIDLDHFKEANDTYGHVVGDALLREVARRLQPAAAGAFFARIGGDEFALIVADGAQPATATAFAERLLAAFADDFEVEGHRLKLGLSIGGAVYPTDGADAKTLMTNADAALYRAKAEFRGAALFFEPEMSDRLHERYALQEDLRLAIGRGELLLHYQTQVKMSGETIGFEALVRWQCPKRGMVAPGTFIPIAEESTLIISVGEWVLREACREAASWPQPLTIAVNISPIQFRHGDLPRLVHSILLETGLAPGRLELEVTESVMINDFSRAVSILNRLKSLGVKIAMDDFGTGYSSLSYLHSFRFDKIKIDRIFICDLESNYHSRAIVRAVIGLGQSLNLPILAEGVETEAQHAYLVQEGCDEAQGYLMGRPLPIADYGELVGRQAIAQQNYAVVG